MTEQYPQFCLSAQSYDQLYLGKPDVDTDVFDSLDKQSFDFAHYGAFSDVVAPHPEQFETDLDNSFASFDADVCSLPATFVDTPDIFSLRSDTPTRGAPSAFTVSSESASVYDSVYGENLSSYNYSTHSPSSQYSTSSYPLTSEEIDMDFKRLGLVNPVVSDSTNPYVSISSPGSDNSSPSSVPLSSPPSAFLRGSFSDYEPSNQIRVTTSSMSDYYPSQRYPTATAQATVSPANVSTQLPVTSQSANLPRPPKSDNGAPVDPKRKYPCPNCPRAFARAFNLKTHIQTHDPNRSKPFVCNHKSCGRAFSRKHDLQRHMISIHRTESVPGTSTPSLSIGVADTRSRCDNCGRSWSGKVKTEGCDCCDDVK